MRVQSIPTLPVPVSPQIGRKSSPRETAISRHSGLWTARLVCVHLPQRLHLPRVNKAMAAITAHLAWSALLPHNCQALGDQAKETPSAQEGPAV